MKRIIFFLLALALTHYAVAQKKGKNKNSALKKTDLLYTEGIQRAQEGNYEEAISDLEQVIFLDSAYTDAYLSLGGVYNQLKNYRLAAGYYAKGIRQDSAKNKLYNLPYSINLAGSGHFQEALDAVTRYLSDPRLGEKSRMAGEYRQKCYAFAVDYEKKNPSLNYSFIPKNLGPGINTVDPEYFPSLTIDGKELVFTRQVNRFNEDFFYSQKQDTGWGPSAPLPGNVNTPQNEGAQMISLDGEWLVFAGCNRPDGWGSCDLYISYKTPAGWSEARNLGGIVNSDQWDSQPCLSPDKHDLYFASRRFGGYGGSDLYVCHLLPDGNWSKPENLGPEINTKGDESTPFMHADNQTLYFTSNGLPGYGDDDIYYSKKGPKGAWSVPVNIGYPVNTIDKEGSLFIATDAKTAYYASDRSDSYGALDIYSFELKENVRPNKTSWVRGKVFDKKTHLGLPAEIELTDLANKNIISRVQTDQTGNYLITLPEGKNYAFNVNKKGYLFYSDNFSLTDNEKDTAYEKNIPLLPIEKGATITLKNIFFDVNKYDLQPESEIELDKVVSLMKDNPGLSIQISGYTDADGKPADNQKLSENRAKTVVSYLINKGISSKRLTYMGFGSSQPVAPNNTEEGKALNRRTELKVLTP